MTGVEWSRLRALFHGALERPAGERDAWLRTETGADTALLQEALALLQAHDTAGDFLHDPVSVDPVDLFDGSPGAGARLGPYTIIEELGRGGMGIVYLAEDARLGRRVALKALPPAFASDPTQRHRLRREARAAATIAHPGVAVVYALEEVDDHVLIASEYVPGRTLRVELDAGPLPTRRALEIAMDVTRALGAAHRAGVVHRDLKPENVILTGDGTTKVVDFGIARLEDGDTASRTRTGALMGTPAYMAPEQLAGGTVDARADLYAVGLLLAEMLTGAHPLRDDARPLPAALAPIVTRCLQPAPTARYASADDLLAALAGTVKPGADVQPGRALWWWGFHQGAVTVAYAVLLASAWSALDLGRGAGRAVFALTLSAAIIAGFLRMHLLFVSRVDREALAGQRRRVTPWVRAADGVFAMALVASGALTADTDPALATLLFSSGLGAALASLVIEPATARAAFRTPA